MVEEMKRDVTISTKPSLHLSFSIVVDDDVNDDDHDPEDDNRV
jgi:hypothetical protein